MIRRIGIDPGWKECILYSNDQDSVQLVSNSYSGFR
jgi:hypothetical protein